MSSTKWLRAVARALVRTFLFTVLAGVIAAIAVLMVIPRATHSAPLTVLTGSMLPTIPVGSVAMVRPVDPNTLQVGDIATYQKAGTDAFVTHRIVDVDIEGDHRTFTFKGDNNDTEDIEPVTAESIRGEVWFHIPYLGSIRDALNGKAGLSLLGMLVLGGYAISQVWGALQDRRRRSGATSGDPDLVEVDRVLVLAELTAAAGDPATIARGLEAIVLREDERTSLFLLSVPRHRVESALLELRLLDPVDLRALEGAEFKLMLATSTTQAPKNRASSTRGSHARA